jgi:hypothetical protein
MDDHRHEPYDIYGTAATRGDMNQLESTVAGLREDLAAAEARIGQLEDALGGIENRPAGPRQRHRRRPGKPRRPLAQRTTPTGRRHR